MGNEFISHLNPNKIYFEDLQRHVVQVEDRSRVAAKARSAVTMCLCCR
jgi:hypothetical protein